jgi:hypothetical protein
MENNNNLQPMDVDFIKLKESGKNVKNEEEDDDEDPDDETFCVTKEVIEKIRRFTKLSKDKEKKIQKDWLNTLTEIVEQLEIYEDTFK